jgi:hypothetical protein
MSLYTVPIDVGLVLRNTWLLPGKKETKREKEREREREREPRLTCSVLDRVASA